MATDVAAPGADEPRDDRPKGPPPSSGARAGSGEGGFFAIYKKGQGYWTRMGTAIGAGLIIALTVHFLYQNLPVWLGPMFIPDQGGSVTAADQAAAQATVRNVTIGICAVVLAGLAALVWWLMNKPSNADFLIATDGEMKKVNWTSRKELIGSTKVVIFFMFLIAAILFLIDVIFGYLFYLMRVLHQPPF